MTTFATETTLKDCKIKFYLTDKTNGMFTDKITIILKNIDLDYELIYKHSITNTEYNLGVGGTVKQGTYTIDIHYEGKDQFIIQNVDGTPISPFIADGTTHTLNWVVVKNENEEKINQTARTMVNSETRQGFVGATEYEEANALFNAYYDSISIMKTDSKYGNILRIMKGMSDMQAEKYAKTTNRPKEEYLNMTEFDQFVWYSTYILPTNIILSGDYETYLSSVENWKSAAVGVVFGWFSVHGTQEMTDSYRALMEWDYNYFTQNGAVMNFFTGKSSLEHMALINSGNNNMNQDNLSIDSKEDLTQKEQEEMNEITSELAKETEQENKEMEKGIWDDTINGLKDNVLSITLFFIFLAGSIGLGIYRKSKAIDDDES